MAQFEEVFQALNSLKEELQRLRKVEQDYYRLKSEHEALKKRMKSAVKGKTQKTETRFYFYQKGDIYTGESASNLAEFREVFNKVPIQSIAFHNERGDFESWLSYVGHPNLAKQFKRIRLSKRSGEALRQKLMQIMNTPTK